MPDESEKHVEKESQGNIILVTEGPLIPKPWSKRLISAWSISLCGAIFTLMFLCWMWPEPYLDVLTFLDSLLCL